MLLEQVQQVQGGDQVLYKGEARIITAIILTSSAPPQFLLAGSPDGAISYRLVEAVAHLDLQSGSSGKAHRGFNLPYDKANGYYP